MFASEGYMKLKNRNKIQGWTLIKSRYVMIQFKSEFAFYLNVVLHAALQAL